MGDGYKSAVPYVTSPILIYNKLHKALSIYHEATHQGAILAGQKPLDQGVDVILEDGRPMPEERQRRVDDKRDGRHSL